jgi:hypothetical protein
MMSEGENEVKKVIEDPNYAIGRDNHGSDD